MPYFQTKLIHKSDQSLWNPHHRRDHLDVFCVSWIVFFTHPSTTKYHQISILDQWTSWAIFVYPQQVICLRIICLLWYGSFNDHFAWHCYIYNGSAKTSSYSSAQSLSEPFCYAVNSKAHRCTTLQRSLDFLWCCVFLRTFQVLGGIRLTTICKVCGSGCGGNLRKTTIDRFQVQAEACM